MYSLRQEILGYACIAGGLCLQLQRTRTLTVFFVESRHHWPDQNAKMAILYKGLQKVATREDCREKHALRFLTLIDLISFQVFDSD